MSKYNGPAVYVATVFAPGTDYNGDFIGVYASRKIANRAAGDYLALYHSEDTYQDCPCGMGCRLCADMPFSYTVAETRVIKRLRPATVARIKRRRAAGLDVFTDPPFAYPAVPNN